MFRPLCATVLLASMTLPGSAAAAQSAKPASASNAASSTQSASAPDPDLQVNVAEPDFTLGALPTTLRMPAGKFSFRMTHRFTRPIASGSAGDFFANFFGFDGGARIGLELRYGIRPGTQATFYRTSDRAIQFLGQQAILRRSNERPYSADAIVAVEGADNFSEDFSVTLGGIFSYHIAGKGSLYVQPLLVLNSNPLDSVNGLSDDTMLLGLGARVRLGKSRVYLLAEVAPQIAGYDPGVDHVSVGIEKRAGGHMFQLTISNTLGTTLRQVAGGGPHSGDWFIGFNLTRRFF